jgi:cytochrome P450
MTQPTAPVRAPYDPLDPQHHSDPAERLRASRGGCPVSEPYPGVFLVARHADVAAALTDHDAFSSVGNFALRVPGGTEPAPLPVPMITMMDPPDHSALRARLRRWFAPVRLRQQEPRIRVIVAEILDGFAPGDPVEVFTALARPVPARTVYALLGLPEEDWQRVQAWADAVNDHLPQVPADLPELGALMGYLATLVAARTAKPTTGADIVDALVHGAAGEPELSTVEVCIHLLQLIAAGTDTTASLITNVLYELLVERDRWERLLADPALVAVAIEESLRHDSPLQYVLRTVTTDAEISGCPISPGDRLVLSLQSANWDERVFGADAGEYSLDRPAAQAAGVAFGRGIHTCLGAPLARLEAQVVLEELRGRFPDLRLAPGYRRQPAPGLMLRRADRLDVLL